MIERYLAELRLRLPRGRLRARILAEVEDHLREAAREHGEDEAVARFGPPGDLARQLGSRFAVAAARLAALAVLLLVAFPILSYPIPETFLPPAPWPEGGKPGHLAWKQDALAVLFLLALGSGLSALVHVRDAGRGFVLSLLATLALLGVAAALGLALSLQWADAVPGTPGWLLLVPAANMLLFLGAATLLVRACKLRAAS